VVAGDHRFAERKSAGDPKHRSDQHDHGDKLEGTSNNDDFVVGSSAAVA
jgi:hypothetical protein